MTQSIKLQSILFTGHDTEAAGLEFGGRPNFIYGASNTGKSFALKAMSFMLGGQPKDLPNIDERAPYDKAWLGLTLPKDGDVTLSRSTKGGAFFIQNGLTIQAATSANGRMLGATHNDDDQDTLSKYLLDQLGFGSKRVAKNASGQTVSLSFRHLVRYCLVDETSIQAPTTPIAGLRPDEQLDRSIFRLLLTGQDDSSVAARLTPPQFRVSKQARLATMDDLIAAVGQQIAAAQAALDSEIPDLALDDELAAVRTEIEVSRSSIREAINNRSDMGRQLSEASSRLTDVRTHLGRFHELERLYSSDIERLEAIEEAGFLLNLGSKRDCPLCGATPEHQSSSHGSDQVERLRTAALAEITKINALKSGLEPTIQDLGSELDTLEARCDERNLALQSIEADISKLSEHVSSHEAALRETLRKHELQQDLAQLQAQRAGFIAKRDEYNKQKQARKDKVDLSAPNRALHDFCQIVSSVLTEWRFPGDRHVAFDEATFDLRIDGKLRSDNGKGVRALTHAAFKLAMLLYCHERGLPHPGFLVLDSPLLTYRDAVRQAKHGTLTADERALAATPVREHFIEHLATLSGIAQIIIFDNIDPPANVSRFANPILFTGTAAEGRYGFFPVQAD